MTGSVCAHRGKPRSIYRSELLGISLLGQIPSKVVVLDTN